MPPKTAEIYTLKVTLMDTEPPIWRRVLVAANLTLAQLHDIVQAAMGWNDSHLHEFQAGEQRIGIPTEDDPETGDERKFRLSTLLTGVGATLGYMYDFGDSWDHTIALEAVAPPDPAVAYPVCVDGKGNCPPEDCGGVYGYYNLLEALANKKHPEHKDMVNWIGSYDPDAFSLVAVNKKLKPFRPKSPR